MANALDRQCSEFLANPDDHRAFEALEEQLFMASRWEDLVEVYQARADAPSLAQDAKRRGEVLLRMAQVVEERCLDLERAQELYWKVAKLDPRSRAALRQLRRLHTGREQWDMVLQLAELEGQLPMKPYELADFMAEMGVVWLRHLDDVGQAMACFDRALEVNPDHQDGLTGRARTLEAMGRADDAASTWERLIALQRGPDRAPALAALARLIASRGSDPDRAMELYRRALSDDPRNEAAVNALSVLAGAREQWPLLADLFERRFDLAAGAMRRTNLALEAGCLHMERLNDPQMARMWFGRALELSPDVAAVHECLAELERRAGNTEALREALDRSITLAGNGAPVSVLLECATLHSEANQEDRALELLEHAHRRAPDNPMVLEALTDSLMRLGRSSELVEVLERRASLAADDPEVQVEALSELGRIHEEDLADREAAVDAYARAFALRPEDSRVARRLELLYRKAEAWTELRGFLELACAQGPHSDRLAFHCGLGELLLDEFQESDLARRVFESALTLDASEPRALHGLARLAAESGDDDTLLLAYEREAAVTTDPSRLGFLVWELVRLLELRQRSEDALRWLLRLLQATPEDRKALEATAGLQAALGRGDDRRTTLERLDSLLAGGEQAANRRALAALQDDPESASRWYERALESQPTDRESLEALAEHYERSARLEDLARVQRRLAEQLPPAERAICLDRLSRLLDEQLGDLDGAIVVLWRLRDLAERPPDASDRLEALLDRAGRFEELAQLLGERRRSLPLDSDEAVEVDLRRARLLLDSLGHHEDAAATFRAVRERRPECSEAIEGLEAALRAGNDPRALAELQRELAQTERDPVARARRELERAVLLDEGCLDREAAAAAYAALSDANDEATTEVALKASDRLEALLERTGSWAELRQRLEIRLARRGDARWAEAESTSEGAIRERLATLCRDRLGDREGCIEHLEAAARLAPERASLWRSLAVLYRDAGRDADLSRVLQAELATGPDAERELTLHVGVARLCIATDPEGARTHYERVLVLDPGHAEAVEFLVAQYEREDRPSDLVRMLETRLASLQESEDGDAESALALRLRVAGLRADALDDADGAIRVLELAGGDAATASMVAEPLADLYLRTGRNEELVTLCSERARQAHDARERAAWALRLGDALCDRGDEASAARAVEAYRAVLVERPDDTEAQAALRDLHRQRGEIEPLVELLERQLEMILSPDQQVQVRLELAGHLAGRLGRPERALEHYVTALRHRPEQRRAFEAATRIAQELGRHQELLALLDERLALPTDAGLRAELQERRGDLLAGPLLRADEAPAAYREALAADPRRASASRGLQNVLETLERWPALLDCLFVEAREAAPDTRCEVYERAAAIAAQHLSVDASLPWLERLRAERPGDPDVLERIAKVHRRAGRPEALLRTLEAAVECSEAPGALRALHVERAAILERELGSPARALAALEAARKADGDDATVLDELDRLYQTTGRHRDRVEVLEAKAAACGPQQMDEERVLRSAAAELWCGALGDPERGLRHWLRAVELVPAGEERADLITRLAESLLATDRIEPWARAAEAELALRESQGASRRAAELHLALARRCEADLSRPDRARRHWQALLDGPAGASLDTAERDEVERALIERLRVDRDSVELERRLSTRLAGAGASDPDRWLELALLRDEQLHLAAAASDAYRATLERRPDDLRAIRGLRCIAERLGDWAGVAEGIEAELAARTGAEPRERAALLRRVGDVHRSRLGQAERAEDCYRQALEAVPDDLEALRSLRTLHEALGQWQEEMALCEREIALLGDAQPEVRRDLWLRVAELAQANPQDAGRALAAHEQAAAAAALPAASQRRWAELYREANQLERFCEVFGTWCDADRSPATATDQLELGEAIAGLGRDRDAIARVRRAVELDLSNRRAWLAAADLHERLGEMNDAADALARAAELDAPERGACHLFRGAALIESDRPEQAVALLRRAAELDAGAESVHAGLARVSAGLGSWPEAEEAAARALDLAATRLDAGTSAGGAGSETASDAEACTLDAAQRLATALLGARAARERGRLEQAVRFYAAALACDAEQPEALAGQGEALFQLGDLEGARRALEARLALDPNGPRDAQHLAIIGTDLERGGDPDSALTRFEEALELDAGNTDAHAGRVRVHECTGRAADAVAALDRWAEVEDDRERCAALWLRAAEIELAEGDREAAEDHLRSSAEANPPSACAWLLLTELLESDGRHAEARSAAETALERVREPTERARLACVRAKAFESDQRSSEAVEAWGAAVEDDPRCRVAAIARARLQRSAGDWSGADETLRSFSEGHPEPEHMDLAEVLVERGRLLSGPLENVEEAIACYERALSIDPDRFDAREPLARLLSHVPERWRDAMAHHRRLLQDEPARAVSLRALSRLAEQRGDDAGRDCGLAILKALGEASPAEAAQVGSSMPFQLGEDPRLRDATWEKLRRLVQESSRELADVLGASATAEPDVPESAVGAEFLRALAEEEDQLGAPGLAACSDEELAAVLHSLAAVVLDPSARPAGYDPGAALERSIGRWSRRKLRRILDGASLQSLAQIDPGSWRAELRTLAACVALDRCGGDLRAAFLALALEPSEPCPPASASLAALVGRSPAAEALLVRVIDRWCDRLEGA